MKEKRVKINQNQINGQTENKFKKVKNLSKLQIRKNSTLQINKPNKYNIKLDDRFKCAKLH